MKQAVAVGRCIEGFRRLFRFLLKLDVICVWIQKLVWGLGKVGVLWKVTGVKRLGYNLCESVPAGTKRPETTLPSSVPWKACLPSMWTYPDGTPTSQLWLDPGTHSCISISWFLLESHSNWTFHEVTQWRVCRIVILMSASVAFLWAKNFWAWRSSLWLLSIDMLYESQTRSGYRVYWVVKQHLEITGWCNIRSWRLCFCLILSILSLGSLLQVLEYDSRAELHQTPPPGM